MHQDPSAEQARGVDISGRQLFLNRTPEGSRLLVLGTDDKHAQVHFDTMWIWGERVNIDQVANTADVKGPGKMRLLSSTDLEGKKLDKPSDMLVRWRHSMLFEGAEKTIKYEGNVQATQVASSVQCAAMKVILDRTVWLNPDLRPAGPEGKDSPKIDQVFCYRDPTEPDAPKPAAARPVTIIEDTVDAKEVRLKYQQLEGTHVEVFNNPDKNEYRIVAKSSGGEPLNLRIWQPGSKDALAEKPAPKKEDPKPKARKPGELADDEEMKLTLVRCSNGRMTAFNQRRRVVFLVDDRGGEIVVVHAGSANPFAKISLGEGNLPPGAVYLKCEQSLDIWSRATGRTVKDAEGKDVPETFIEMEAKTKVRVRTDEFYGDADKVGYVEEKGTITFEGRSESPVNLWRFKGAGVKPEPLSGVKIVYEMKTKGFTVTGASGVGGGR